MRSSLAGGSSLSVRPLFRPVRLVQVIFSDPARFVAAAIVLILTGLASPAVAHKPQPGDMLFAIVRASNPVCEPLCPEWIAADGEITHSTAKEFKAFLKKTGDRNLPLLINSSGGHVDQAMEMGKIIRERKMTVEVARTGYLGCSPRDKTCEPEHKDGVRHGYANTIGAFCNSACPLVLAGGVKRVGSPVSVIGVHQITTLTEKYQNKYKVWTERQKNGKLVKKRKLVSRKKVGTSTSTELSKAYRRKLETYLTSMGVKATLINLMMSAGPDDLRVLNVPELRAFGLATEVWEMEALVHYHKCTGKKPPEHCITR